MSDPKDKGPLTHAIPMKDVQTEGLPQAYRTADFDFTAYVLTLIENGDRVFELVDVEQLPRNAEGAGSGFRFAFLLVRHNGEPIKDELTKLEYDYLNGQCAVEPTAFVGSRRHLRAFLDRRMNALRSRAAHKGRQQQGRRSFTPRQNDNRERR